MNARLSVLALVCLVAGALPWFVGGPLPARLLGVPFLLLGVFVAAVARRVHRSRPVLTTADFAQLAGCACGGDGCCGGAPASTAEPGGSVCGGAGPLAGDPVAEGNVTGHDRAAQ